MVKVIASISLISAACALQLGNYFYTFGLWPKSWLSFFGFSALTIIVMVLQMALHQSDDQ